MKRRDFYLEHVYPKLNLTLTDQYPQVSLMPTGGYHTLAEHKVLMLVALTGTGKTTTLEQLARIAGTHVPIRQPVIPTRREVADWIAIPTAQVILGEPIQPVRDRVKRFHYTRTFAEHIAGGMATAFSWVHIVDSYQQLIMSEGIRGPDEIFHALENCPGWYIVELTLHPLERLRRLSSRDDHFDQVEGAGEVSFLPDAMRKEARRLLIAGEITSKALTIMRAESKSYGLLPFSSGADYPNYHRLDVDSLTREQVAEAVLSIMKQHT